MQSRPFGAPLFEGSICVLPHRMASENGSESEGVLRSLCQGCSGSLLFKFKMIFFSIFSTPLWSQNARPYRTSGFFSFGFSTPIRRTAPRSLKTRAPARPTVLLSTIRSMCVVCYIKSKKSQTIILRITATPIPRTESATASGLEDAAALQRPKWPPSRFRVRRPVRLDPMYVFRV